MILGLTYHQSLEPEIMLSGLKLSRQALLLFCLTRWWYRRQLSERHLLLPLQPILLLIYALDLSPFRLLQLLGFLLLQCSLEILHHQLLFLQTSSWILLCNLKQFLKRFFQNTWTLFLLSSFRRIAEVQKLSLFSCFWPWKLNAGRHQFVPCSSRLKLLCRFTMHDPFLQLLLCLPLR